MHVVNMLFPGNITIYYNIELGCDHDLPYLYTSFEVNWRARYIVYVPYLIFQPVRCKKARIWNFF